MVVYLGRTEAARKALPPGVRRKEVRADRVVEQVAARCRVAYRIPDSARLAGVRLDNSGGMVITFEWVEKEKGR